MKRTDDTMRRRTYLTNASREIRYWGRKELCLYLGVDYQSRQKNGEMAAARFLELAASEGMPPKYKKLASLASLFSDAGTGIFEPETAYLAGEVLLAHPLKSLSPKENRILAAAICLLNLPEAERNCPEEAVETVTFIKSICPDRKNRRTAALVCRAVGVWGSHESVTQTGFQSLVKRYIEGQIAAIEKLAVSGSMSQAETVHDIRVALRRLMSLATVFAPYLKDQWILTFYPGLERALKALGNARDYDVLRERMDQFLAGKGLGGPDIPGFISRLETIKKDCTQKASAYLESQEFSSFMLELKASLAQPICSPVMTAGGEPRYLSPGHICCHITALAFARIRAYHQWMSGVLVAEPMLHRLRLVYKDLRFLLEFFTEFLDRDGLLLLKRCKEAQETLGGLHDCTVMARRTRKLIKVQDFSQAAYTSGELDLVRCFLRSCEKRRRRLYRQYVRNRLF